MKQRPTGLRRGRNPAVQRRHGHAEVLGHIPIHPGSVVPGSRSAYAIVTFAASAWSFASSSLAAASSGSFVSTTISDEGLTYVRLL